MLNKLSILLLALFALFCVTISAVQVQDRLGHNLAQLSSEAKARSKAKSGSKSKS